MKKILSLLLAIAITFSLYAQEEKEEGFQFESIINIETTPVKNQASSSTCWDYSSTSYMETEVLRQTGKLLDLSEMFTVFNTFTDKADSYVRMHGHFNFGPGGASHDLPIMMKKYGAVPESVYNGLNYGTKRNVHGELDAVTKAFLDAVITNKNKKLTPSWKKAFKGILEAYLGDYPEEFEFEGKKYTPKTFADEVLQLDFDKYVSFTSWSHEPFNEMVHVMVPDNWLYAQSLNVPMEELTKIVDRALENGFSVAWASDWSEKGISWKKGIAFVPEKDFKEMSKEEQEAMFSAPSKEKVITQELRQEAYDNYSTTDDHGLHIVGLAKDQTGKDYYIVKNSWGEGNVYGGYFYVSKAFFNYKTLSIMLHADALKKKYKDMF